MRSRSSKFRLEWAFVLVIYFSLPGGCGRVRDQGAGGVTTHCSRPVFSDTNKKLTSSKRSQFFRVSWQAGLPTTDTSFVNEAGEALSFVKVSSDANTTVYELKFANAAEITKAPAVTNPSAGSAGSAPQTFDPAVIIAAAAAISAAGVVISKKKR